MKIKGILIISAVMVIVATGIVLIQQRSHREPYGELPQVMSNYQKIFKLDTSPAIFPDGKTTISSNKTNAPKP